MYLFSLTVSFHMNQSVVVLQQVPLEGPITLALNCQDEGKMHRLCLVKIVGGLLQYLCLMCKKNGIKGKTAGYEHTHKAPDSKTQLSRYEFC